MGKNKKLESRGSKPSIHSVIAIDGPAGAGKSTIANMLAKELGYAYVDTGAMYRALTWEALRRDLRLGDEGSLAGLARRLPLRFAGSNGRQSVYVGKSDVTEDIRTEPISRATSRVSKLKSVREVMVRRQRVLGKGGRVVMEGRDIGTAVFPSADFKFFLDASPDERARRRFAELKARGVSASLEDISSDIRRRDHRDRNRRTNPLRPAPDAHTLDSTHLSAAKVVEKMLRIIKGGR